MKATFNDILIRSSNYTHSFYRSLERAFIESPLLFSSHDCNYDGKHGAKSMAVGVRHNNFCITPRMELAVGKLLAAGFGR